MAYDAIPAQPTSGQDPWYVTETAWKNAVEVALGQIDDDATAHATDPDPHVPSVGTNGQVLTKNSSASSGAEWADPTGSGGTSDHGALVGLNDPDHPIAAISGLQAALDLKALTVHTHPYEPIGGGTAAVSTHVAASDPHPAYLTNTEAGSLFAPLANGVPTGSGTSGQVLTKGSGLAFAWQTPSGGGTLNPPVALTGTDPATVPLTVKGAAAQTANLSEVRDNANTIHSAVSASGETILGTNVATQNGTLRVGVSGAARQGILVRLAAGQTAKGLQVTDSNGVEKFSVTKDGLVAGQNIGAPVLVLDAAASVPVGTLTGTVILRRQA